MSPSGRIVALRALLLVGSLLVVSPRVVALDVIAAQTLSRQSGCLACHSVYQKKLGPAWKDVASKYHSEPGASQKLTRHVTTGRKARFDDGHEEDHPIVKTRDP
jgi:cytochrome c